MRTHGRGWWLLAAAAACAHGCASGAPPRDAHLVSASPLTIESGIMARPVLVPRGATEAPVVICVDPSLDVTLVLADSILARARGPAGRDSLDGEGRHLVELAERTRSDAASLRSTLARLCGEWARYVLGPRGRGAETSTAGRP